jgi:hypothetical protein
MTSMSGLSKIVQIRARDGDGCWLCGGKLDFDAAPNSKKAPTQEHLQPRSKGGSNALANLVLCHPGCNKQLGDRPEADKRKMRAKRLPGRMAQPALAPAEPPPVTRPQARGGDRAVHHVVRQDGHQGAEIWRTRALIAAAVALFAVGLSLGLFVGGLNG